MRDSGPRVELAEVERWLDWLYIAADGAGLRAEDRRKAVEVTAMLGEIGRPLPRFSRRKPLLLVDAAAGKSYLGLLAARLLLAPSGREARVIALERDPSRTEAARLAAGRLDCRIPIECRTADVGDPAAWPDEPSLVAALHGCGRASDVILDRCVACRARVLLLVPCCTGREVAAASAAEEDARRRGIPPHAPVRRRYLQAMIDAERTWRLEAAGYETEVVEFVGATVTPHNLLWRARRVMEPARMARAQQAMTALFPRSP